MEMAEEARRVAFLEGGDEGDGCDEDVGEFVEGEEEVDEVLRREREELEALVGMMEEDEGDEHEARHGSLGAFTNADGSGSGFDGYAEDDDEEYDSIFMHLIDEQDVSSFAQTRLHMDDQAEEMDMS